MTEYQRIENELLQLGWTTEQGEGDHIKFRKEGIPDIIVVSKNINSKNRSLNNMYADIRRKEPGFLLGRPTKAKKSQVQEQDEPIPDGIPEWMHPTKQVRYITPENACFDKLDDPQSVMNIPYTVLGLDTTEENTSGNAVQVLIRDNEAKHEPFRVTPADLASWELKTCPECGKKLPASHMPEKDGKPLCPQCAERIRQEQADKAKKEATMPSETPMDTALKQFYKTFEEIRQRYGDVPIGNLPEGHKKKFVEELRQAYDKMPSKLRKEITNGNPKLKELLIDNPKKTPFGAWQAFLSNCTEEAAKFTGKNLTAKEYEALRKRIHTTSFGTRKIRIKNTGKSITLIELMARSKDMAKIIWSNQDNLFKSFKDVFEGNEPFAVRLQHPGSGLNQYLVNACSGTGEKDLELLMSATQDADNEETTRRTRGDLRIPCAAEAMKTIQDWAYKAAGKSKQDNTLLHAVMKINLIRDVRISDTDNFENAPAFFKARIMYNDVDYDPEGYDLLRKALTEDSYPFGFPAVLRIMKSTDKEFNGIEYDCLPEDFGKEYDKEEEKEEILGTRPGETIFKVVRTEEGFSVKTPDHERNEDQESYQDLLHDIIYSLFKYPAEGDPVRVALLDVAQEIYCNKENTTIMNETNYLEETNPGSENATAGALTTRELLKELKSRGISFDNLEITIRKSININDI